MSSRAFWPFCWLLAASAARMRPAIPPTRSRWMPIPPTNSASKRQCCVARWKRASTTQLSNDDKKSIDKRLDQLDAFYVKRGTGAKLHTDEEAVLISASSEINALLVGEESKKLVCEHVKILGSNRRSRVCMSVADREERRRADQIRVQDQNLTGRKFREQ